jgi:hypothetical protein
MDKKIIIGIVIAIIVLLLAVFVVGGFLIYKKGSFSNMRVLLGKSKVDKLIDKINSYLRV